MAQAYVDHESNRDKLAASKQSNTDTSPTDSSEMALSLPSETCNELEEGEFNELDWEKIKPNILKAFKDKYEQAQTKTKTSLKQGFKYTVQPRLVRLLTPEEKKKRYKAYWQREDVKRKRRAYQNSEEVKKKREAYQALPEVAKRRKQAAKRRNYGIKLLIRAYRAQQLSFAEGENNQIVPGSKTGPISDKNWATLAKIFRRDRSVPLATPEEMVS